MITKSQIQQFFRGGPVAVAGVSRNPLKFGNLAFKTLLAKGNLDLIPMNPYTNRVFDRDCYRNIASLPEGVHALVLFTHPEETASMVLQAMKKGIRNIWIQRGSESNEAIILSETHGYNIIFGKCVIMFNNRQPVKKLSDRRLRTLAAVPVSEKTPVSN